MVRLQLFYTKAAAIVMIIVAHMCSNSIPSNDVAYRFAQFMQYGFLLLLWICFAIELKRTLNQWIFIRRTCLATIIFGFVSCIQGVDVGAVQLMAIVFFNCSVIGMTIIGIDRIIAAIKRKHIGKREYLVAVFVAIALYYVGTLIEFGMCAIIAIIATYYLHVKQNKLLTNY